MNKIRWSDDRDGFFVMERDGSELYMEPSVALAYAAVILADAAERIAAALEAGSDNPDAYEYHEVSVSKLNAMRAEGYRLYKVVQYAEDDGAEPAYIMRHPRQQE